MNDLQSILKDLYLVSGLNLSIFDIDEHLITSYPVKNSPFCHLVKSHPEGAMKCKACDHRAFEHVKKTGELYLYQCDFHLYEAVAPLYTYGKHSGYLMMGQTLTSSPFEIDAIKQAAKPYVHSEIMLEEAIQQISYHSHHQIQSFAAIIDLIGKYMTLTNRIEAKNKNLAMEIKRYIHLNYQKEISIDRLCHYFYCSRGTLTSKFKQEYGCSIHQFLENYRLEKALTLLNNSRLSLQEIADQCGFKEANYFSKVFKKKYGISPANYRKQKME